MSRAVIVLLAMLSFAAAHCGENTVHSFEKTVLSELFFAEGANFADFNKDGKMDIVAGPFWFEGPDFKTKHVYYAPPDGKENKPVDKKGYAKNFFAFTYDFNADGYPDILIFGFPGEDASWFENSKGKDGPWTRHKIFNVVDNESPQFEDITGDGKPEISAPPADSWVMSKPTGPTRRSPGHSSRFPSKAAGKNTRMVSVSAT